MMTSYVTRPSFDPYAYHRSHPRPSAASLVDDPRSETDLGGLLGWEGLQRTMQVFLTAVDTYASTSKSELARRSNEHLATVGMLEAEKADMERDVAAEREREGRMLRTLEQERLAISTLEQSLSRLNASLGGLKDKSTGLDGEMRRVRGELGGVRGEKERQRAALEKRAAEDEPELDMMEDLLGWRVMGVKEKGVIMMSFSRIDPERPEKEFSLLLDLSKDPFTVTNCSLPLPILHDIVGTLNEDRNVGGFIKRVRQALRSSFLDTSRPSDLFKGVGSLGAAGEGLVVDGSA